MLSKKKYNVSSVFIIFEEEETKRAVVDAFNPPLICSGLGDSMKFNGVSLNLQPTEEPSAIRWDELNVPFKVSKTFISFFWCMHIWLTIMFRYRKECLVVS